MARVQRPWHGVTLINRTLAPISREFFHACTEIYGVPVDVIIVATGKNRVFKGPKIPEISAIHRRFRCHAVPRCN